MTARFDNPRRLPRFIALMVAATALLATTVSVSAQATPVRLTIKPVGEDSSAYFTITADPGESFQLEVELGNAGTTPMEATTFVADTFTMPNGGFGINQIDDPRTGTSTWVSYPTQTLTIDSGQKVTRAFTLTVPDDIAPGDYLTSLVIQNADAIQGAGSVALNQIVRQAVAISIDVPGPRTPALAISGARHESSGGRSVITFDVGNTGNTHLKPTGEFVLRDSARAEIVRRTVTMDRFYSRTETTLSVALDDLLAPGDYFASLTLTDPTTGASARFEEAPVNVPIVEIPPVLNTDGSVAQPGRTNAPVEKEARTSSLALLAGIAGGFLALGVGLTVIIMRLRARRSATPVASPIPAASLPVAAPPPAGRPGSVKPLISRPGIDDGRSQSPITQTAAGIDGQ